MLTDNWIVRELAQAGVVWGAFELLRVTLVLLVVTAAAWLLRRASAGARHLAWAVGVVTLLALPVLSGLVPWRLAIIPLETPTQVGPVVPFSMQSRTDQVASPDPGELQALNGGAAEHLAETAPASLSAPGPKLALPMLLAVWLLGATALLGRLLAGWIAVRRVLRNAVPVDGADWMRPLLEGADRMGLPEVPRVVASTRTTMPFACGVLRPTLVLPAAADDWSDGRRRAVLLHELAHVRRGDVLLNLLGRIACALYWFHPLVWIAARQLRAESERACDDLVLSTGARASTYADHLLQIACRAGRASTPAVALPMAQRREFEGRMLAILETGVRREGPTRRVAGTVAIAALALAIPLAALAPAARADAAQRAATPAEHETAVSGDEQEAWAADADLDASSDADPDAASDAHRDAISDAVADVQPDADVNERPATNGPNDSQSAAALSAQQSQQQQQQQPQRQLQQNAGDPVPALLRLLRQDSDAHVRMTAAWSLAEFDDERAIPGLAEAVTRDADARVRGIAAWALGEIEDERGIPALTAALADDVADVRLRAAWALGQISPQRAPEALIRAAEDAATEVRVLAIWALGQIEDEAALPIIGRSLESATEPELRRVALWAIGSIGGEVAGQLLLRMLEDPDPTVRAAAARGLAGAGPGPWPWPWPMPGGPN